MIDDKATERFMSAPWLAEVDVEIKRGILGALAEERATAGAVLLRQGEPNDHLSFLIDGTVELERNFGKGRREVLTTLSAPAVFGTTSFFQPKPPTVTVHATSEAWMLTLHHPAHEQLRRDNPRAAEALAVAVVRAVCERFDLIDRLFTDYLARHPDVDSPQVSEWSRFRSRLFEEHGI